MPRRIKHIVVVDPELLSESVKRLGSLGYRITRLNATDIGDDATGKGAIYLVNVTRAGFDGIGLIRRLREGHSNTWIIAVSHGDRGMRPDIYLTFARIVGADRTLFRPTTSDLLAALPQTMHRKRRERLPS